MVHIVAYSSVEPDGKTLAAASTKLEQGTNGVKEVGWEIKLWDPAAGKTVATLRGVPWKIYALAFSPDGKTLTSATGGWKDNREVGKIQLWDVAAGKETAMLELDGTPFKLAAYHRDGKTLVTWGNNGLLNQLDIARGFAQTQTETGGALSAALSPDGNTLALGHYKNGRQDLGAIELWDVATGQKTATLLGHRGWVSSLAFSPDSKRLASGGEDQEVFLWDLATGKSALTLKGESGKVLSLAFSPDGKTLTSGSQEITFWDLATGKQTATLGGHTTQISCLALHPDGKTLISGGNDHTIRLWELPSGMVTATLRGDGQAVYALAISADGKTLASGNGDGTVQLWDVAARRKTATLKGHASPVVAVAFSPDGKTLASGNMRSVPGGEKIPEPVDTPLEIHLWDVPSGQKIATLRGHTEGISSLVFSADGKTLASASAGEWDIDTQRLLGEIKLWDVAGAKELGTIPVAASNLAFCASGKTLAASLETVTLWDVATRKKAASLEYHDIGSLACRPDGKLLAFATYPSAPENERRPGTIHLWDITIGKEVATLQGNAGRMIFSADGRTLASIGDDRTIDLWDIPLP